MNVWAVILIVAVALYVAVAVFVLLRWVGIIKSTEHDD